MALSPFGCLNLGNTCYMNALVQFMLSFNAVVNNLSEAESTKDDESKIVIKRYVKHLRQQSNIIVSLEPIMKLISQKLSNDFGHIGIPDCVNLGFTYLLDMWKLEPFFKWEQNVIIRCINCEHKINNSETMMQVLVPPTQANSFFGQAVGAKIDRLVDYKCDQCREINKSVRGTSAKNLPKVLVFTFQYVNIVNGLPTNLEIRMPNEEKYMYRLKSVIHYTGGHYVCSGLRVIGNQEKVYFFNDQFFGERDGFVNNTQGIRMVGYERQ